MKLCKLKLRNLNSFRDNVEIDFEKHPLDDASLVAITGPTGAGKTTILDAICVALYGKTPRLSGTGRQNPHHLISHGEKEGFAEVHFIANGTSYICMWSCKANGSPKGSLLKTDSDELISDRLSTKGKSLGSSENTISEVITSILGLDFDAFKRSVMLAQGEFAAFLKASSEDRRAILEATAGITIYDKLREVLNAKANEVMYVYKEKEIELEKVPDASAEILTEANTELTRLQSEAEQLGVKNGQIQKEKESETDRTEDFKKLQSSEAQHKEFINQQLKIDELIVELARAEQANRFRPEKQTFDAAELDSQNITNELKQIETELKEAQNNVESNKTNFDEEDKAYKIALSIRDLKIDTYHSVKIKVSQAQIQFEQANQRNTEKERIDNQIQTCLVELSKKQSGKDELQAQIDISQTFITNNPLPSDRHHRLSRVREQLANLNAQQKNLQEKVDSQTDLLSDIDSLNETISELTKKRENLLTKKDSAVDIHAKKEKELKVLKEMGTIESWKHHREVARKAQPIAHQFETKHQQICAEIKDGKKLQYRITTLDESLGDLEAKLEIQSHLCTLTQAEVDKLMAEKQLLLLTDPINKLRQQLEPGEPCSVCGATDHPFAGSVELDDKKLHEQLDKTLDNAKTEAKLAQDNRTELEQQRIRSKQDISNCTAQIESSHRKIDDLNTDIEKLNEKWYEFYESQDISTEWVEKRLSDADSVIGHLNAASNALTDASNDLQLISQRLDTCERDINRENELLEETKQEFASITDEIEDLKYNLTDTENRFWELMPDVFNDVSPEDAIKQFGDLIEEVANREDDLRTNNTYIKVLSTEIQSKQREIDDLSERSNGLQTDIENYNNVGESILGVVREKTGGLETEEEINSAIEKLEEELQQKNNARDQAEQLLQESQHILTQKHTSHGNCKDRLEVSKETLNNANSAYFKKLEDSGFSNPEEHNIAFRSDEKIQEIREQIDLHESMTQQLEIEIIGLRTQFEETPFDPELLAQIKASAQQIATEIEEKQQQIGAQQQIIGELKENFKKRQELDSELQTAKIEMERWQTLREIIPANTLRDFALDITFKQVSRIANEHLKYLTSERYQLKVETIGKLSVLDRWNANEERPVETLSGGESFLTSLALALALSELSQGRAQLNSLFLDEGFGTLDSETLDIAIAALEGLRMQGRSIFLISHIQELTRRLPVKINVRKRGNGSSTIDTKQ